MELTTLLASGGIKSVQTGWVDTTTPTMVAAATDADAAAATGEDQVYVDVTISSVDVSKSVVSVEGGFGYRGSNASVLIELAGYKPRAVFSYAGTNRDGSASFSLSARLINATTVRISTDRPYCADSKILGSRLSCRWSVVEGK